MHTRECRGVSRRSLLHAGALAAAGLALPDLLRAAPTSTRDPPARSVILLWLWGGPSHLDTFDPKPQAPARYRGPYVPIQTPVPGTQICEMLPRLAERADRYSLIRSLNCTSNDHGIAGTIGLTGSDHGAVSLGGELRPGQLEPTHGSVVSRVMGFSPDIPRFMTIGDPLHQGRRPIRGEGGGRAGAVCDPFRLNYSPVTGVRIPNLELVDALSPGRIENRRGLLVALDRMRRELDRSGPVQQLDSYYQRAFSMLTSTASRAMFDLDLEQPAVRTRYGRFRFGQCCLLARRLIEAGARFVQVNWSSHVEPVEDTGDGGWDMHDRYFQQFQDRHAWMLDQALSALLDDLHERGLLEETAVIAIGEFGRTPAINGRAGRDHWHQCYSGLVAGGGLRSGEVVGASDRRGEHPVLRPITPADLFATVLLQLGIRTPDLTRAGLQPLGEPLEELL